MRRTHLSILRGLSAGVVAGALAACGTFSNPKPEPIQVNSQRLVDHRASLAGKVASISGYLVAADTIADRICLRVLVNETLRAAPMLLIERRRREADVGQTWSLAEAYTGESHRELRVEMETDSNAELAIASADPLVRQGIQIDLRTELLRADAASLGAGAPRPNRAVVIQACKLPPTDGNERAIQHALEWLAPLKKPERVEKAPDIASLRRELQLFYVERSGTYDWTPLAGEEVVVTGTLVDGETASEDEILAGIDLVPSLVGIHDPQRGRWLVIDLNFDDSIAKELTVGVFRSHLPRLFKGTTKAALKTLTP